MAQTSQSFYKKQPLLGDVCTNPSFTNVCNIVDITTPIVVAINSLKASNTTENALISAALNNILAQTQAINTNTDTIEVKLQYLIDGQIAENLTLTQIQNGISSLLPELQVINANTDQVESLITTTNIKLNSLIAEQDKEYVPVSQTKFHIGATNYYVREIVNFDSETNLEVSRLKEYSSDGVSWGQAAPTGTPAIGWYQVATGSTLSEHTGVTKYNDNGINYYSRQKIIYDQATGTYSFIQLQNSLDGVNWNNYSITETEKIGWVEKKVISGVYKITNNPVADGTTELPNGFTLSNITEIINGTHKLISFSYKIYWNSSGEYLEVYFDDTGSTYHYDDIFYHGSSKEFSASNLGNIITFTTRGKSFFELTVQLQEI